jgi:hypothetical protein
MILEFVREKLKNQGLSEDGLIEVAGKLELVILKRIMEATEPKLTDEEKGRIREFIAQKDPISLARFLKGKYSPEEWKALANSTATQVLNDYSREVLGS